MCAALIVLLARCLHTLWSWLHYHSGGVYF